MVYLELRFSCPSHSTPTVPLDIKGESPGEYKADIVFSREASSFNG